MEMLAMEADVLDEMLFPGSFAAAGVGAGANRADAEEGKSDVARRDATAATATAVAPAANK